MNGAEEANLRARFEAIESRLDRIIVLLEELTAATYTSLDNDHYIIVRDLDEIKRQNKEMRAK